MPNVDINEWIECNECETKCPKGRPVYQCLQCIKKDAGKQYHLCLECYRTVTKCSDTDIYNPSEEGLSTDRFEHMADRIAMPTWPIKNQSVKEEQSVGASTPVKEEKKNNDCDQLRYQRAINESAKAQQKEKKSNIKSENSENTEKRRKKIISIKTISGAIHKCSVFRDTGIKDENIVKKEEYIDLKIKMEVNDTPSNKKVTEVIDISKAFTIMGVRRAHDQSSEMTDSIFNPLVNTHAKCDFFVDFHETMGLEWVNGAKLTPFINPIHDYLRNRKDIRQRKNNLREEEDNEEETEPDETIYEVIEIMTHRLASLRGFYHEFVFEGSLVIEQYDYYVKFKCGRHFFLWWCHETDLIDCDKALSGYWTEKHDFAQLLSLPITQIRPRHQDYPVVGNKFGKAILDAIISIKRGHKRAQMEVILDKLISFRSPHSQVCISLVSTTFTDGIDNRLNAQFTLQSRTLCDKFDDLESLHARYLLCPGVVGTPKTRTYHTLLNIVDVEDGRDCVFLIDTDDKIHSYMFDALDPNSTVDRKPSGKTVPDIALNLQYPTNSCNAQVTANDGDTICEDIIFTQLLIAQTLNQTYPKLFSKCIEVLCQIYEENEENNAYPFFGSASTFLNWNELTTLMKHTENEIVYKEWTVMDAFTRDLSINELYEMFCYFLQKYAQQNGHLLGSVKKSQSEKPRRRT